MQGANSVTLTLRGAPEIIGRVTMDDLLAYVDLRSIDEGQHQLSVRVDLPAGIEVTAVSPARLDIDLERILSSQTTVSLVRSGEAQPGYFAPPGTIEPAVVLVTGRRSSIGEMVAFFVVVDISQAQSTLVSTVTLVPLDAEGQVIENLNITPEEVTYTQPIYPVKSVPIRAVLLDDEAEGYELSADPVEFKLAGPKEVLDAITELVLELSLADVIDGQFTGELLLPADVLLLEPDTTTTVVTVTLKEE